MQANKAQFKAKMTWLEVYILRSARFEVLFIKEVFTPSLARPKKKDYRKTGKLNATQKWKKILEFPLWGLNHAFPNRSSEM